MRNCARYSARNETRVERADGDNMIARVERSIFRFAASHVRPASFLFIEIPGEVLQSAIDGDGGHHVARAEFPCQLQRADQVHAR